MTWWVCKECRRGYSLDGDHVDSHMHLVYTPEGIVYHNCLMAAGMLPFLLRFSPSESPTTVLAKSGFMELKGELAKTLFLKDPK